jgi:hypothetical protein
MVDEVGMKDIIERHKTIPHNATDIYFKFKKTHQERG